jgi:hypothetical protein
MLRGNGPKLILPAALAFCVLATSPGCGDDTAGSGGSGTGGTGGAAGGGGATGGRGGSGGSNPDPVECYDRTTEVECTAPGERACFWDAGYCYPDCEAHATEEECLTDPFCGWTGTSCLPPI